MLFFGVTNVFENSPDQIENLQLSFFVSILIARVAGR